MMRLVIYDLDGTLVDTKQDIAEAVNHMLAVMHHAPLETREIQRGVGLGLPHLISACLRTDDRRRIDEGMAIYRAHYSAHLLDHTTLYPHAKQVLEVFRDRIQVVMTNKPNPYARDILIRLGVAEVFAAIIAGDSEFPRKPDPAAVLAMMRQHGVGPDETMVVGDSPIDIETGRRAGVMTVALTHGFTDEEALKAAQPDVLVRDFGQFLELAKQQEW